MSDPLVPSAGDIASRAMAATSQAFDSVKALTEGMSSDRIHSGWLELYEAGRASTAEPGEEETWIRQAAMMLLVGVQSLSGDSSEQVADESDDDAMDEAWRLLARGRSAEAEALAEALLQEAESADDEDVGDLVHQGHLILGHVCLGRGDEAAADEHLLAAADVVASPVLASFGPNMSLARALLLRGRPQPVLAYFERCALFWGQLPGWRADVLAGQMPSFGPNLVYGIPDDVEEQILNLE